ncbi:MAG TPA: amino acid permease [Steroidobacteraceae bacterium]|nr:amino acid permease [Steroidobacteraceae bacterium]
MSAGAEKIGPALATFLVAGNMIGSGIFLLPATLASIGGISLLGWAMATAAALAIALGFARLAARDPKAGGPCAYAQAAFGRRVGFLAYLFYVIICWVGNLGVAIAAIGYLGALFPGIDAGWSGTGAAVLLIALLTLLNLYGPRRAVQFDAITIICGLLPVLLVASFGWLHFDAALFRQSWNPGQLSLGTALPRSLLLVFWAFLGLESASIAAAVVDRPERNVAVATLSGVLLAALVYIAASAAIFGLVPVSVLSHSNAPFADATRVLLGSTAAGLVALAALIKTVGTLSGWILLAAQTGQAAAAEGFLPRALMRQDARGVPVLALLVSSSFTCLVAMATKSATLSQQFVRLVELSVLLSLSVYAVALAALLKRDAAAGDRIDVLYRSCALLGIVFCAYVIGSSTAFVLWTLAALVLVTMVIYAVAMRGAPRPVSG